MSIVCTTLQIHFDEATGVTTMYVRSPITLENHLPCPLVAAVTRDGSTTVRFFWTPEPDDEAAKEKRRNEKPQRIRKFVERGTFGSLW